MKRKISVLLAAALMTTALSACGSSGSGAAATESTAAASTASNATAATDSGSGDPIKIGYFGPLTGGTAQAGQAALYGAQIAVDEINAAGGVLGGRQLEIVSYDDKSSPEEAVKDATKLIQVDEVNAIFGSLHSANVLAAADVIEEGQTLCVAGGTSPTWLEQGYTYLFRSISNSNVSTKQLAEYAAAQNLNKIAIFTSNSEYGISGADAFKAACEGSDIEFVANETMTDGDRDFTGQFANIIAANPDAVFVWCLGDDLGAVTKQLRQAGYEGTILGSESYTLPEILEVAGDTANGVVFATQYIVYDDPEDASDEKMKAFLEAYIDAYGSAPASDNAFRAYDGVKMIAYAMEESGADSGEALREAYNNIDGYEGLAGVFSYAGGNGEGIESMRIFEIADGEYVEVQ